MTSKRFVKAVQDTFEEVDVDRSGETWVFGGRPRCPKSRFCNDATDPSSAGTISHAELFVAILLLNHQVG